MMRKIFLLGLSHSVILAIGFALGIYFLPILTAPKAPEEAMLIESFNMAEYKGEFRKNLRGSDALHWGEGEVSVSQSQIAHQGRLSPGPAYKLYLLKDFVDHEEEFLAIKSEALYLDDIKSFNGFIVKVPEDIDIENYSSIIIWCEAFSEFITAAHYKK